MEQFGELFQTIDDLVGVGRQALPPVRGGRIIAVDGSQFNRPSPRIPEALAQLTAKIRAVRDQCYANGRQRCAER